MVYWIWKNLGTINMLENITEEGTIIIDVRNLRDSGENDLEAVKKKIMIIANLMACGEKVVVRCLAGMSRCYDDITEVLTENGWKFFKDILPNERVATRNKDGYLEYQTPDEIIIKDYSGDMYLYNPDRSKIEFMVSPNHDMFLESRSGKTKYKEKINVIATWNRTEIPRTAKWNGREQEYIEFKVNNHNSNNPKIIRCKMDDFLAFLGMWLAEGSLSNDYHVRFCERRERKNEIEEMLNKLGFNYCEHGKNDWNGIDYIISCKDLYNFLKPYEHAENKHIPRFILNLSSRQLKILFDWYISGVGSIKKFSKVADSVSKQLMNDMQEIALKIGLYGNIYNYTDGGLYNIMGKICERLPLYRISFSKMKKSSIFPKKKLKKVHYKGNIYCVTVPNHVIYVRRNGKPMWCGNSNSVACAAMMFFGVHTWDYYWKIVEKKCPRAHQNLEFVDVVKKALLELGVDGKRLYYVNGKPPE